MEEPTTTTSQSSSTTPKKNSQDQTLFIVVHNIHHMRLEFPPPPSYIIPTAIWDRVVSKLRRLGLKFIYSSTGNIDDDRLNHPVAIHHEYNIHTDEFKHAKDGIQEKYAQETDPILGKVVSLPGDMNFVQEEIVSSIQQKARDVIDQQDHHSETFSPKSALDTIVAVFLLWWIFVSIAMIRSYISYYHQRMNALAQTNTTQNQTSHVNSDTIFRLRENAKTSENQEDITDDELSDENPIENSDYD
ncbi:hypothetical protein C1645_785987 [Glomus cerebriforme]|uniref:Uncharacterized protein n=1 Tax=Glomus cerebriforme TaxID=658196 RepID=A0A397SH96_9GLOM|nr:hypothetical protein C1645_785987 [Glomus cerebriforme]